MTSLHRFLVSLGLMVALSACGSDSPCEVAAEAYCDRACDCTDGGECRVFFMNGSSTSDDRASCVFFNKNFVCGEDENTTDEQWDACGAAVDSAMCTTDNGETGMQQVPECEGLFF